MVVVTVLNDSGHERSVNVERGDLVAEVKARIIVQCFPLLQGKMISLQYHTQDMDDAKLLGEYTALDRPGVQFLIQVPSRQPYGGMNYNVLSKALIKDGKKNPTRFLESWHGKWEKGDEYKSYPPVDVNNAWSSVQPSQSRELSRTFSNSRTVDREEEFRQARANSYTSTPESAKPAEIPVRIFQSSYICQVLGSRFEILHKMEGKWLGEAAFLNNKWKALHEGESVSNTKIWFDSENGRWIERQQVTNPHGISHFQTLLYYPRANGVCDVELESSEPKPPILITLQEIGQNVVVITSVSLITNQPVSSELITFSADFQHRVRTIQRFDNSGHVVAVYIHRERKYIDTENGAMERVR